MEIESELGERVTELIENQLVGVLSTTSKGKPYSCLVSFRFTEDLESIIFATKRDRLKYRKMMENHNVSIIIDDRENRPDDFQRVTSLTVLGTAQEAENGERKLLMDFLLEKHPHLSEFVRSDDTAIIQVSVNWLYIVTDFERVTRVRAGSAEE
jgi:uncharacterized pyridoxamine 5'-phosphate oxidase family protein